jgi:gamma-glutamyltranspeptidase
MCPSIVTRGGVPIFAAGGAGGTRIPNSMFEVLVNFVGLGASLEAAMKSPRLDTNGTLDIGVERSLPEADEAFLRSLGYRTSRVASAYISAVTFDPPTRSSHGLATGGA